MVSLVILLSSAFAVPPEIMETKSDSQISTTPSSANTRAHLIEKLPADLNDVMLQFLSISEISKLSQSSRFCNQEAKRGLEQRIKKERKKIQNLKFKEIDKGSGLSWKHICSHIRWKFHRTCHSYPSYGAILRH